LNPPPLAVGKSTETANARSRMPRRAEAKMPGFAVR
jgi:hypothetical protein